MRKPWRLMAAVAAVGLCAACGPGDGVTPAGDSASSGPSAGAVNTPVMDGALAYTVTSLDCDGVAITGATPKGRYCAVGVTVRNSGEAAAEPGIAFAKAYDAGGTAYLADAFAEIRADTRLLDQLAPGATITDRMIYDVPKDETVTSVVLFGTRIELAQSS
ncbi:DUF4352 domain-containing protein [Actinoplanes sp. CA-054009]